LDTVKKIARVSGGRRGIGLAVALRAARDDANIAIAAKTTCQHALAATGYAGAARLSKDS
jgi:NAD(P)-dependent dehydrogenase (short-subunit alcohol dehydrogenase family)